MGTTFQTLSQRCWRWEGNPPISRTGARCPAGKGGHSPTEAEPLSLQISLSKLPRRGAPSPSLAPRLSRACLSKLSSYPTFSGSQCQQNKPRPQPGFQGQQDPPDQHPHQLIHPVLRQFQGPHCSSHVQYTCRPPGICTCYPPSLDTFHSAHHLSLFHSYFKANSRVPSFRQYLWRATDVSLNHPDSTHCGLETPSLNSPTPCPFTQGVYLPPLLHWKFTEGRDWVWFISGS